jgi:hypothetical protein
MAGHKENADLFEGVALPEEEKTADAAAEPEPERVTLVKAEPQSKAPLTMNRSGLEITSVESLWRFSKMVAASGLAPKGLSTPEAIAVALEMGMELGLKPMAALQNIAVINGRPGIFGDAALALVRASGLCEYVREVIEGDGDKKVALCTTKRQGDPDPLVTSFSVDDAKRAKLWGKEGPWTQYPERMLRFRARGFNLRDNFPDVLRGMHMYEEIQDIEIETVPDTPSVSVSESIKARLAEKLEAAR